MNSMINICQAVYNITPIQVNQSVTSTNKYYGGKSLGVSRIIFPNGEIFNEFDILIGFHIVNWVGKNEFFSFVNLVFCNK